MAVAGIRLHDGGSLHSPAVYNFGTLQPGRHDRASVSVFAGSAEPVLGAPTRRVRPGLTHPAKERPAAVDYRSTPVGNFWRDSRVNGD
jgi:hypothetical protein